MSQMTKEQGKARRWKLGIGGVILVCMACGLLNCLLSEQLPQRDFEIEELLIDATVFPSGWRARTPRSPASAPLGGQTSFERTTLSFHTTAFGSDGVAVEEIHRYVSVKEAAREFKRVLPMEFREGEHWTSWELPEGFRYQSPYADRIQIGCARETWEGVSIEFCRMVGQYEEYVVRFSTKISPEYMTYLDFERIVQAIDERMGHYLGKRPVRPTP